MSNKSTPDQLAEVISKLMAERGIDDITLSNKTGIPASTLCRLKSNQKNNPTVATLKPIANFFNVTLSQLLAEEALPNKNFRPPLDDKNSIPLRIPVIKWDYISDWSTTESTEINEKIVDWAIIKDYVSEKSFASIVPTDSLGPLFLKESLVIIDTGRQLRNGDFAFFKLPDGQIMLKKTLIDGADIYLKSVTPDIDRVIFLDEKWKCIGVVSEVRYSL